MIKIVEGDPSVSSFLNESEQNVFRLKNWFNPFSTNIPLLCENNFNYLWKHQKAYRFLMFSGGESVRLVENGLNIVTRGSRSKTARVFHVETTWKQIVSTSFQLGIHVGCLWGGIFQNSFGQLLLRKWLWEILLTSSSQLLTLQLATQDFLYQCKIQNYDSQACWY